MRKRICLILGLIISFSLANSQELEYVSISSPELEGHIIDHISEKEIGVYLPSSYGKKGLSYPVLYFLPGYGCGYFDKEKMIEDYNQAQEFSDLKELIVVFIEGCTPSTHGAFFVNSTATGYWDDFIVNNVIKYIDAHYKTIPQRASRAIAGHSMGGFGAINIAMLHPDLFCAVYAHSPGLFSETGLQDCQMFNKEENILACAEYIAKLSKMSRKAAHQKFAEDIKTLPFSLRFAFEYGMAIAPDTTLNAPYIEYPFTITDGQLVKDKRLWVKWESGFGGGINELKKYKSSLNQLDTLVIDYGTKEYYPWIPEGCVYYSQLMTSLDISHTLLKYEGPHINIERYSKVMFPLLTEILEFK